MQQIIRQIHSVRAQIDAAAASSENARAAVRLVAVSKMRSFAEIAAAHDAGIVDFGESYLQEALPKIAALEAKSIRWHFIGAIQANKTRDIARHFDWVQTLDRARIAERLAKHRPAASGPLNVLIQVNIDAEPQKAGVDTGALAELIDVVLRLPALRLRGLMAIPRPDAAGRAGRASFARMAALFDGVRAARGELQRFTEDWDTLSMGMTNDFPLAVAEGATMVRVGTGIFGVRTG
jgi:PLP dependent protein